MVRKEKTITYYLLFFYCKYEIKIFKILIINTLLAFYFVALTLNYRLFYFGLIDC